jgi:hypothetical protein
MSQHLFGFHLWLVPLLLFGCGSSSGPTTADDGRGHGASYACGTESEPVAFRLKDVLPVAGTTVVNKGIVQQFTLEDPPFILSTGLSFILLPKHTAGTPNPVSLQVMANTSGKDHVYSTTVDSWTTAPGHVELSDNKLRATQSDCVFVFPSPLFSYDVTSP